MALWQRIKDALSASPLTSEQQHFQQWALSAARQRGEVASAEASETEFAITLELAGVHHVQLNLHNIEAELRALDAEARGRRLEDAISAVIERERPLPWEEASTLLVPVIRAPSMFQDSGGAIPVLHRQLRPGLVEAVVLDGEHGMKYVTDDDAERWEVSADAIFAQAREVLASRAHDIAAYPDADGPLRQVGRDDAYQSSRLLLPGFLASLEGEVEGTPVAIIPHHELLVVGGSEGEGVVERLLELAAQQFEASPRALSLALYAAGPDGAPAPWVPPPGAPGHEAAEFARVQMIGSEYTIQKQALDEELSEEGIDVFVAAFDATRSEDGVIRSHSVWTRDVDTWLPETDDVALLDPQAGDGGTIWLLPWEKLVEHCGDLLQPVPGVLPTRLETLGFPAPEVLERLEEFREREEQEG